MIATFLFVNFVFERNFDSLLLKRLEEFMPSTAILFGRLLILVGIIGYGYGMYNGNPSLTALIPAAFGLVMMILGHFAESKVNLRKHLMHVAVVIGLLGFLMPIGRILSKITDFSFTFATVMLLSMAILCLVFVLLCVKSFTTARKS
jgi:hypothetical protein